MVAVSLRPITQTNFNECISLKVADTQKEFVASNVLSLAEAFVNPTYHPFGIYDSAAHYQANPSMVGFTMYELTDAVGFILRLMIDEKFQRKGYGRAAMLEVIRRLKLHPEVERIATSHVRENEAAARLYEGLGFVEWKHELRGEEYSGERYLILQEDSS
ncbi:MAG: GNAT family N-acetyltransferase [Candidatus Poribacteria bacterium]|nr:GNAT family N-acetyltransferase [Candidatus Poribacteria bacterium]